jgi:hypothetical protein
MRYIGRTLALCLAVIIVLVTPCAFWMFNLQRVALDAQTYTSALQKQNVYQDFLPALVDIAATNEDSTPAERATFRALLTNMSMVEWAALSEKLLPPSWLQEQIEGNINRFFAWIDGSRPIPDITFDLTILKTALSENARSATDDIFPKLPACTAEQESTLTGITPANAPGRVPLCNSQDSNLDKVVTDHLTATFNALGTSLPDRWDLAEQIRKADIGSSDSRFTEFDMVRVRSAIWVQSRLTLLLFLIPLALLSIIVIVAVRSGKSFFRWTGWTLIGSGLLALLPVPFFPGLVYGTVSSAQPSIHEGFAEGGRIVASLLGGMMGSMMARLTLSVLVQVAITIVVGFLAVALSVILPAPEPSPELEQLTPQPMPTADGMAGNSPTFGSTPRPLGSTPCPLGSTPISMSPPVSTLGTPEPPQPGPAETTSETAIDPLNDLFNFKSDSPKPSDKPPGTS